MSKLFIPVLGGAALGLMGTGMVVSSLTAGAVRASSSANATPAAAADKAPAKASEKRANMIVASSKLAIDAFLRLLREHYLPSLERRRRKSERRGRSCERGALGQTWSFRSLLSATLRQQTDVTLTRG